jgi:NSS family neurotransmitter:Na+ symporter
MNWKTKLGFVFAAMGSAIGLGNIWRFPGLAYENGGGSFLIPYFIALITVGIPLLLMEIYLGLYTKKAAPNAFASIKRPFKIVGILALLSGILIVSFYTVVIAWTLIYTLFSLIGKVSPDLFGNLIKAGAGIFHGNFTTLGLIYVFSLLLVWLIAGYIVANKVKGLEKLNLYAIPIMWVIIIGLLIYTLTLPGALKGIVQYLTPNFEALKDPKVWIAAFGQIFFSLSLGFGIMVAYAKYLKKEVENSKAIAFGNSSFELISGFLIFGILGFLMTTVGVNTIYELAQKGFGYNSVNLSFKTLPYIFLNLPASYILATIFFFLLFLAGLTSLVSLIEAFISAIEEEITIKREKLALVSSLIGFLVGLIYIYNINILDYANDLANYLLVLVGLAEVIIIGWLFNNKKIKKDNWIKIGKYFGPVILSIIVILETLKLVNNYILEKLGIKSEIIEKLLESKNYYPSSEPNFFMWISLLIILGIVSYFIFSLIKLIHEEKKEKTQIN